jgi:hypothetical protein
MFVVSMGQTGTSNLTQKKRWPHFMRQGGWGKKFLFCYSLLCLPKSFYGLGVITVPDQMINKLEQAQNLIIRNTLGLTKFNHIIHQK